MKLKFFGAAGEVTGSSFWLTGGNSSVLIDMGMFQGLDAGYKNSDEKLLTGEMNGVILTHAHLDHCGRLPLLVQQGFKGKIFANKPTIDLTYLVLKDAAKIAESNIRKGGIKFYSETDVEEVMGLFEVVEYEQWKQFLDFRFRLIDAGHILGSSSVEIEFRGKRMVFSGDLGNEPSLIVDKIEEPATASVVVMESTYGDRLHPAKGEEMEKIGSLCDDIEKTKGTLLMPAFSLERTQELLLIFDHLKRSGRVEEELPVFLDSPMGLKATAIYEKYPQLFNEELKRQRSWDDPFDFPGLVIVEDGKQSKMVDGLNKAKVIIAGSGMMTGGRIVFHARKWLPDPKTILLFTGYQAEGTLGRKVLDGQKEVVIDGLTTIVKARVEEITTMSAHADQRQLLDWLKEIKGVEKVVLIHGEDRARKVLKDKIEKEFGYEVILPNLKEEIEIL